MKMALRTRIFSAIERRTGKPVDEADPAEFPMKRKARLSLQRSLIGRFIFGTADADALIEDTVIDFDGVSIRLRIYRPAVASGPLPIVINFHGGGWVQGNVEQSEWAMSRIAVRVGAVVISVDYRLAPEDLFPAAVEDCWATTQWIHEHAAELGGDPDRLAVMGDSAGGNLAAVVALHARDAGAPVLKRQVLIYPGVEMYDKWPSEIRNADAAVLTSRNMRGFAKTYLGSQYGTEDWRASPIRAASHAGLAPALIQTAEFDPLLDNGARYADILRADGVEVDYIEYAGTIHGYLSLPGFVPMARKALDDIVVTLIEDFKAR
ncbi:MAG: alpha/beta hydrolase [Aeromicrobium sp.]